MKEVSVSSMISYPIPEEVLAEVAPRTATRVYLGFCAQVVQGIILGLLGAVQVPR